jgi:aspartyl-tRNA synthetase
MINIPSIFEKKEGNRVAFYAWINKFRHLGNLLFFVCQDNSRENNLIQVIVKRKEIIDELKKIKKGSLLKLWGLVKNKNEFEKEILLEKFQLINSSKELPFEIKEDLNINEDTKYRYRYLDLRRKKSNSFFYLKNEFIFQLRQFLHQRNFVDIETPILAQRSPEGANCFLVQSNLPNRYYTLPQSAQLFKQLIMVSGFANYYQIAKSFRNEDARSNRQIEFSQLELEMSFVSVKKIQELVEKLLIFLIKKVFGEQKKITFVNMTYKQVQDNYQTDKPDLRGDREDLDELKFLWINDWPLFEYSKEKGKYESFRHPFTLPKKKFIKEFLNSKIKPDEIICEAFDLVCNGEEVLSGSLRIYQRDLQEKVLETLGYDKQKMEKEFGYFLEALEFAAPPHGGAGLGIDRILSIIMKSVNLKELIAFPKNIDGTCSLTGAPNYLK